MQGSSGQLLLMRTDKRQERVIQMLCQEIIEQLEARYPVSCAMNWDNVGLLAGSRKKDVQRIYVAVDATDEVIEAAVQAKTDMLITHHPMIFSGMKRVTEDDFIGRRVLRLIRNDIAYYAMHTNYDVMGMAELSGQILGLRDADVLDVTCEESPLDGSPQGIGRVADLEDPISLRECCELVKAKYELDAVKVFGNLDAEIRRVAISPGSGKSMIASALSAHADVLITGDIDHHTGIDAVAQGLMVIDGGHYGIEKIFVPDVAAFLREKCPGIEVMDAPVCDPFQII